MASQTVTFPCPFCGRRMGVPAELLGKQVRCPHCKQVVLAPVTAAPAAAPASPPPAPAPQPVVVAPPAPPPAPESELPVFNFPQRKEGADSILSEPDESEDEVFGSHAGNRMRTIPPLDLSPAAPPAPPPPPAPPATTAPPTQVADLEPVSLPAVFAVPPAPAPKQPAAPQPAAQPVPLPAAPGVAAPPAPAPASLPAAPAPAASNPFADFDASTDPPPPAEEREEDRPRKRKRRDEREEDEPEEKPARGRPRAAAGTGGGVNPVILYAVAGYALLATILAVYGLFIKSGDKLDTGHPLSTIPDNFGEFDPATRKKVAQYKFPVDGELPADQRTNLGGKVTVGQIEVQPLRIEKRRLVINTESTRGEQRQEVTGPALVLTLAIKNASSDWTISPMDPAFTRRASGGDQPITRIVINKSTFYAGGAIPWPNDPDRIKKRLEKAQEKDSTPLKPGESGQYVVFTDPLLPNIAKAVEGSKDTMQWRVQVRREPIEFRGKEVPVTAIVGVDFTASDVKPQE